LPAPETVGGLLPGAGPVGRAGFTAAAATAPDWHSFAVEAIEQLAPLDSHTEASPPPPREVSRAGHSYPSKREGCSGAHGEVAVVMILIDGTVCMPAQRRLYHVA
jgi:hypothetical protein